MRIAPVIFCLFAAACGPSPVTDGSVVPPSPPGATGAVASISFEPTELTLPATHTALFAVIATDGNGNQVFGAGIPTYTSSDARIATATNGTMSGHLPGTATITATLKGKSAQITVTVVP